MSINLEWIGQTGKYSHHMVKESVAYPFWAICFSSNYLHSFELKKNPSLACLFTFSYVQMMWLSCLYD